MENILKVISWNITRKCNLQCSHCYLPATHASKDSLPSDSSPELTTSEGMKVIDQIASINSEVMLILSGGEPLLREDIYELSEYASGKGMMVVLGSNGLLMNDEIACTLKQKGVSGISISLDSIHPQAHDRIRFTEGSWNKALNAVKTCQSNGLSVQINTVVTKNNYKEIPDLIRLSHDLGAKVYSPFFLVCTGRGEEITDITPEQYEHVLATIVEYQEKQNGIMIRTRCAPTFRRILYEKNPGSLLLKMDAGKCMAGKYYCRISPEGNVTPCPYMPVVTGNIKEKSFQELWENSREFLSLRNPFYKGKCKLCEFQLICGGCRARAYSSFHDAMEEDPWCAYSPKGRDIINPPVFQTEPFDQINGNLHRPVWTKEAEKRLKSVPFFVRSMVRSFLEKYASENRHTEITPALMDEAKHTYTMGKTAKH
jgi:radical SAM protein with 4Fe4S-binding SPASM domain